MILWLPNDVDLRTIPRGLARLERRGLEIRLTSDLGPHTKYYRALSEILPNQVLVTADDDIVYPRTWLARLLSASSRTPEAVWCYRARQVRRSASGLVPYRTWPYAHLEHPSAGLFFTGVGGAVYPPALIEHLARAGTTFTHGCLYADDVWLNGVAAQAGILVGVVDGRSRSQTPIFGSQGSALARSNVLGGDNDRILASVFPDLPGYLDPPRGASA
ncbi:MAG: hypothetical protein WAR57_08025 [Candidatus Phosphoribacter sp.]